MNSQSSASSETASEADVEPVGLPARPDTAAAAWRTCCCENPIGSSCDSTPARMAGSRGTAEAEEPGWAPEAAAKPSFNRDCSMACLVELIITVCRQADADREDG